MEEIKYFCGRFLEYKEWLLSCYAVSSVNSMLVALNQFLTFREMGRLRLKQVKVQRSDVMGQEKVLEKKEFQSLVCTAREQGKEQIAMIMETICATGIRISELKFFRVENIRTGMVKVWNKGKHRIVLIPDMLKKKLPDIEYIFEGLNLPLIKNFPASHSDKKATIPYGTSLDK